MLLLLVPLYSLYELAILAIRVTHWRAAARQLLSGVRFEVLEKVRARKRHRGGEGWRFRAHLSG